MQRSYANESQEVAYVFWILSQIWRKKQKGFYARTCTKTTLSRKLFARWKTTLQIDHSRFFLFCAELQDHALKEGLDSLYERPKVFFLFYRTRVRSLVMLVSN